MDLTPSHDDLRFRAALRGWLDANPPGDEPLDDAAQHAFRLAWQRRLHAGGWLAPAWPVAVGGLGSSPLQTAIHAEELARAGAPSLANEMGITMAGPVLIHHGDDGQRDRLLPTILDASEIWCQGFSEPDAGSDLAALRTRATQVDGGWEVTGQKVWTSFAQHAKWCMLLARTGRSEHKHAGISFMVMDMEQAGVEVRPLRQLTGGVEFNELFLEAAFVPDEMVVGGVGNGWAVAMTTLSHERGGLSAAAAGVLRERVLQLVRLAGTRETELGALQLDRLIELYVDAEALRATALRNLSVPSGRCHPSLLKLQWSDLTQATYEMAVDLLGYDGLRDEEPWLRRYLRSLGNAIEGGTTDVQKNVLAHRVLGLPRSR